MRIVVLNCADIDLVMWVSCLNTTFWSSSSTDENEIIIFHATLSTCRIFKCLIGFVVCVVVSIIIITHIMMSCLPLHGALEFEATQGLSIEYYRNICLLVCSNNYFIESLCNILTLIDALKHFRCKSSVLRNLICLRNLIERLPKEWVIVLDRTFAHITR